jgi:hypothetical protein
VRGVAGNGYPYRDGRLPYGRYARISLADLVN